MLNNYFIERLRENVCGLVASTDFDEIRERVKQELEPENQEELKHKEINKVVLGVFNGTIQIK